MAGSTEADAGKGLGNRIAPPRFVAFALIAIAGIAIGIPMLGWRQGVMAGFDAGALVFLLSCVSLLDDKVTEMRQAAARNDANRTVLLAITVGVTLVILVAIASELSGKGGPGIASTALIVATLVLVWMFSNVVYALHYGHIFYLPGDDGKDSGGLDVPGTEEPDYWDLLYFSCTMGMTFQTSDIQIESPRIRRVALLHGLVAFVFNIGVLAFTINVLGGS